MKKYISLFYCVLLCCGLCAQTSMYDENVNAMNQIRQAVEQAKLSQKYVLCQVGGNWCPWCIRFAHFADTNATVNKIIENIKKFLRPITLLNQPTIGITIPLAIK